MSHWFLAFCVLAAVLFWPVIANGSKGKVGPQEKNAAYAKGKAAAAEHLKLQAAYEAGYKDGLES